MPNTPDQFTQTHKQIQALFRYPVPPQEQIPAGLSDWYHGKRDEAQKEEPEAYPWARNCFKGAALSPQNEASQGRIDVYVSAQPGRIPFQRLLDTFFPGMPLRVVVVSRFRAVQAVGSGADVTLGNGTGGKIALFLQDSTGQMYALTCNHVLDAPPANQPVFSGSRLIGTLFTRVEIQYGPTATPNLVDCALVKLNSGSAAATRSLPIGATPAAAVAAAVRGTAVSVTNNVKTSSGTVETPQADIEIVYPLHPGSRNTAFFDSLIAITPSQNTTAVVAGDSGSLVSATNVPAGMVMAVADSASTTDNPPVDLGQIVIACNLQTIISQFDGNGDGEKLGLTVVPPAAAA